MLLILVGKLRQNISKIIRHIAYLLNIFENFTNRSFQIKRKFWRQNNKEEKVEKVSENEDVANHFNNDFNFVNSDPTKKTNCAIPTKIVKLGNKQMYYDLVNCINACINQSKFPNQLK